MQFRKFRKNQKSQKTAFLALFYFFWFFRFFDFFHRGFSFKKFSKFLLLKTGQNSDFRRFLDIKNFQSKMAIFAVKIFFLDPSKGPPFDFQKVENLNFSSDSTFSPKVLKVSPFDPKFCLEPELRIKLDVWRSWACLFCKTPVFQGPKRSFLGVQKHLYCH